MTYIPGADPYSFWATLVLPSWHQRFERSEVRYFFRETLYREVPAMVGLNILWLSPRQMCQFESTFKDWLDWYRDPASLCENQDRAVCELVNCIKEFRNDPLCLMPEVALSDCDCLTGEQKRIDQCIDESEQLFWSDCPSTSQSEMANETSSSKIENGPTSPGEKESTEESISFIPDPIAIRKLISEREEKYKNHMLKIYDAEVPSSDIFERGRFFVQNPPSLSSYQHLCAEILRLGKEEIKNHYGTFVSILQIATGYLLDHLVVKNPENIPDEDKKSLEALLVEIKSKGINVPQLVSEWQGKPLQEILGASVVEKYIKFFESF